jgi:hypothetical protein
MHARLLLSLFAITLGCASNGAPPASPGQTAPSLVGRWKSACTPMSDTQAFALDFDIAASTWKLDYVVFGDKTCSAKFFTVHIEGPYAIGAASTVVPGAYDARFAFDKKTITPHGAAAAQFLSSDMGCKLAFTDGVATDVGGSGCANLGQYPIAKCAADYDVVKIEGDALHFGDRPKDNDMCTEAKRPRALSPLGSARQQG